MADFTAGAGDPAEPMFEAEMDDLLVLCSVVEEYKEALENKEAQNVSLERIVQRLDFENALLREEAANQSREISRLDESLRHLHMDLEQLLGLLSSKESDLLNMQHCLSLVHKKKVEVDDVAAQERTKAIEQLTTDNASISQNYSTSLQSIEDYLDLLNGKDSEILDLRGEIKRLWAENQELQNLHSSPASLSVSAPSAGVDGGRGGGMGGGMACSVVDVQPVIHPIQAPRHTATDRSSATRSPTLSNNLKPAQRLHAKPAHLNRNFSRNLNSSAVEDRQPVSKYMKESTTTSLSNALDFDRAGGAVKSRVSSKNNFVGGGSVTGAGVGMGIDTGTDAGAGTGAGTGFVPRGSSRGWSQVGRHDGLFGAADIIRSNDASASALAGSAARTRGGGFYGLGQGNSHERTQGKAQGQGQSGAEQEKILAGRVDRSREETEFGDFLLTVDSNPNSPERYPRSTGGTGGTGASASTGGGGVVGGGGGGTSQAEEELVRAQAQGHVKHRGHREQRGKREQALAHSSEDKFASPGSPSNAGSLHLELHRIYAPASDQPSYLNAHNAHSNHSNHSNAQWARNSEKLGPPTPLGAEKARGPSVILGTRGRSSPHLSDML
jgi:hypothetical protein